MEVVLCNIGLLLLLFLDFVVLDLGLCRNSHPRKVVSGHPMKVLMTWSIPRSPL